MAAALEICDVSQWFRVGFWMRSVQILRGVSFSVEQGAFFGFLGANGAGKTTLIHLMAGLRKPTRGQIKILGNDSLSPAAKSQMGYLPERPYFYEHLTGGELLQHFGVLSGLRRAELPTRISTVLSTVGLSDAKDLELRRYSKGMLQRIGIAQALIHDPQVLILDEPMSGLDPIGRKEMRELMVDLAAKGHTIFFSSHVIPDVEAVCTQVAVIRKGHLIGCGPIAKFLENKTQRTEIAFRLPEGSPTLRWPEFETIRQIPATSDTSLSLEWKGTVVGDEVSQRVLGRLMDLKAKVLWVMPIRPSLEDLFDERHEGPTHNLGNRGNGESHLSGNH